MCHIASGEVGMVSGQEELRKKLIIQKEGKDMYNVTLRGVGVTIVAVEKM